MDRISTLLLAGLCMASCHAPQPALMAPAMPPAQALKQIQQEMKKELGPKFTVEQIPPIFCLASDAQPAALNQARSTLRRTLSFLRRDFFTKPLGPPIRVYLFADKRGYDRYCQTRFGKPPSTPFGFYLPDDRTVILNLATGTGTLAHELVHPLLTDDFSAVPVWFNEGFASLFEESKSTDDGDIVGRVNWRLPALQQALPSHPNLLEELVTMSTDRFYSESGRGVHYAATRYLCLYLQERGWLKRFYDEFRRDASTDPTGRATLESVSGMSLPNFEKEWRQWVGALRWER